MLFTIDISGHLKNAIVQEKIDKITVKYVRGNNVHTIPLAVFAPRID